MTTDKPAPGQAKAKPSVCAICGKPYRGPDCCGGWPPKPADADDDLRIRFVKQVEPAEKLNLTVRTADIGSAEPVGVDFDPPARPSTLTEGMHEVSPGVWARDAKPVREVQVGHIDDDPGKDWPTEPVPWPTDGQPLVLESTLPEPTYDEDGNAHHAQAVESRCIDCDAGEDESHAITCTFYIAGTQPVGEAKVDQAKPLKRISPAYKTETPGEVHDDPDECAHGNPADDECPACDAYAADMAVQRPTGVRPPDPINPAHYNQGDIECIDALRSALTPEQFQGFCRGNAIKYLWRLGLKGSAIEQLDKTEWYLSKLRQELEDEIP